MLAIGAGSLGAQNTRSGYFADNYTFQYEMNPAFGNDMNFVSIPGIGNLNVTARGNTHLTDFYYNVGGKTVLFTNPGVSPSFLKDLHSNTKLGADLKVNILSGGWKAWGGYNTVTINARAYADVALPKEFFRLAKEGLSNTTYDISNMNMRALGYAELALNHSRDIPKVPGLRAGVAVKFLIGMAALDARFKEADLTLGTDSWRARTNADIYASLGKMHFKTKTNDRGETYVSGVETEGASPNGFGMAFDLGAAYKWKDFDFSLSVVDLGFLSMGKTIKASTNGVRTIDTDAYIFNANEDAPNSFENEWDRLSDDLDRLYQLEDMGDNGSRSYALGTTINVGIGYTLPYYRGLKFGILSTTRILGNSTWSEARISATCTPVKCFSATVDGVFGTYGAGFGWLLNYTGKGFNVFLGMDNTLGKLSKEGIPLNSNASVNFGMTIPF